MRWSSKTMPTRRTLAALASAGWTADNSERRQGPITIDLFGCIDIVAVHPKLRQTLFVQVTSDSNRASRVKKVKRSQHVQALLESGARVEIWTWAPERAAPKIVALHLSHRESVT